MKKLAKKLRLYVLRHIPRQLRKERSKFGRPLIFIFSSLLIAEYLGHKLYPLLSKLIALIVTLVAKNSAPAWFAAIGTLGTLMFLVVQNNQIRKEQKLERVNREEHERTQQKMWDLQMETINFQKYESHKLMFSNLLGQLEKTFNDRIIFYDKDGLYNSLFPENTPLSCNLVIDQYSREQQSGHDTFATCLSIEQQLKEAYHSLNSYYYKRTYSTGYHHWIMNFMDRKRALASKLHIKFDEAEYFGDVSHFGVKVLNVFEASRNAELLTLAMNRISNFVNVKHHPLDLSNSNLVAERVLDWFFEHDSSPLIPSKSNVGGRESLLRLMFECRSFINLIDDRAFKSDEANQTRFKLRQLFSIKEDIQDLVTSRHSSCIFLAEVVSMIKHVDDNYLSDGEHKRLKDILQRTESTLNNDRVILQLRKHLTTNNSSPDSPYPS